MTDTRISAGEPPTSQPLPAETDTLKREEGLVLSPRFDAAGLVTAVVTDGTTGDILMVAHMNAEALARTLSTGDLWYWSRSRHALWRKGETSGHTQKLVEMRVDCDQDALWIKVEQTGPACHTNRKSCFYRRVETNAGGRGALVHDEP